jgi:hypothetical protein
MSLMHSFFTLYFYTTIRDAYKVYKKIPAWFFPAVFYTSHFLETC